MLGAQWHAVTELKTGCTTSTIAKKDLDQLGGSVRWDGEQYPDARPLPVMVHPSRRCDRQGTPVPGMRVVTPDKLELLTRAVTAFAVALAGGRGSWGDEQAVAAQLTYGRLDSGSIFQVYAETPRVVVRRTAGAQGR